MTKSYIYASLGTATEFVDFQAWLRRPHAKTKRTEEGKDEDAKNIFAHARSKEKEEDTGAELVKYACDR